VPETVVVAAEDPAFRAELADALSPAGISTVPIDAPAPTLADIASASRELAERSGASATIWLVAANGTTTLVTYDRGADRVLVRALPFAPPLTEAQGAEAARMARTMLRALRVTPDSDLPPPRADRVPIEIAASVPARHERRIGDVLAISAGLGVRERGSAAGVTGDGSASLIWRPGAIGAAVAVSYAPASAVMGSTFGGTLGDDTIGALVRVPIPIGGSKLRCTALGGGALHMISLRGSLANGTSTDLTRYDPAVRASATVAYPLDPSVDVGLGVSADYLLEHQRYEVDGAELLEIPRFQLSTSLVLTLRVL
jgi:hypothetical protein